MSWRSSALSRCLIEEIAGFRGQQDARFANRHLVSCKCLILLAFEVKRVYFVLLQKDSRRLLKSQLIGRNLSQTQLDEIHKLLEKNLISYSGKGYDMAQDKWKVFHMIL